MYLMSRSCLVRRKNIPTSWYNVKSDQVIVITGFCFPWNEDPDSSVIGGLLPSAQEHDDAGVSAV